MNAILTVVSVNEKMKNGTTQPFSVKCDNGKNYILKGINAHCSGHTLFNELISYRLAVLLDLPIPSSKLVNLPKEQIISSFDMETLGFSDGICFASEYILGMPRINHLIIEKIVNKDDIPGIVLFDQLIINDDRSSNDGNLYFDRKNKRLTIIDHSHIFGGWQTWNVKMIEQCITDPPTIIKNLNGRNYKFLKPYIAGHSPFAKIQESLSTISEEDVSGLFDDIPLEWKIKQDEIDIVKKLIWHQIVNFNDILPQLKNVFTKWKGVC